MGHFQQSYAIGSTAGMPVSPVMPLKPRLGLPRPARARSLLAILQDGVVPEPPGFFPVLRPLWAAEAMHRIHSLNHLVKRLESERIAAGSTVGLRIERYLALDIARLYRVASHWPAAAVVPSSALLRDLSADLVALFGTTAGGVELETHIEPVSLPGFQCRALALAVSELIINSLTHAFPAGRGGTIWLDLRVIGPRRACLRIMDDGIGCSPDGGQDGIAAALAELLESELVCRTAEAGGTIVEITFPIA